ncbi:PREDICTED: motile sperm domain-containing protein 2-like [Papilio xuthus]|uniref:Motile sperm domain-containing protein 2-like n=1 Tax=Papilio xuthus TaxID=66420 RepID=A0AAJ7E5F6_PAPXU|nr:PREDICTED: motile sperm domain-containing protein 2-like [Papilio xuthus]
MRKVDELRYKFQEKLKDGVPNPPGEFDTKDIERVKDDKYMNRIIEHCEGNVELSLKMLWSTLIWRKNNNINNIKETVNMDYVREGLFFPRGRDIDGCLIFILKWKLYNKGVKNVEELKKVVVYWLERLEREESGKPITVFFDLDGCGLNNIEVEVVAYMITLLKNYYPKFVNYIIIYQMPWIMSAGYRIVKGLLPARAVERLRVINKEKMKDIIPLNQALKCYGGTDSYEFEFVPERNNGNKRVKFVDVNAIVPVIQIIPNDYLTFTIDNNSLKSELTVINPNNVRIAFKIRTTGPEKFKVKPTSGILSSNGMQKILITILSGFDCNVAVKERFLFLSTCIDDGLTQKQIDELWQNPKAKINEHRLKCKLSVEENTERKSTMIDSMDKLDRKYFYLIKSVDVLKSLEILTLAFSIVLVVFGYLLYNMTRKVHCDVM